MSVELLQLEHDRLWNALRSFLANIIEKHATHDSDQDQLQTLSRWCYYRDRFIYHERRPAKHPDADTKATEPILFTLEESKKATIATYRKHIEKLITVDKKMKIEDMLLKLDPFLEYIFYHIDAQTTAEIDSEESYFINITRDLSCIMYDKETHEIVTFPLDVDNPVPVVQDE